jgi:hypothetical protein
MDDGPVNLSSLGLLYYQEGLCGWSRRMDLLAWVTDPNSMDLVDFRCLVDVLELGALTSPK